MRFVITAIAGGAFIGGAILLACGSSDDRSAGFDPGPDGSPAETSAMLPESSVPTDASQVDNLTPRAPFDAAAPTVTCGVTPCVTRIVAGYQHFCAVATDGLLRCWGDPGPLSGYLDGGDPEAGSRPVVITGESTTDLVDISASSEQTCLAHLDGGVDCFGSNSPKPVRVADAGAAKSLAISDQRSCAADQNGDLKCWGQSYQWGMGDLVMPLNGDPAIGAAVDTSSAFALGKSGTVYSWGADLVMLGRDTPFQADLTPEPVADLPKSLQITANNGSAVALTTDGRLFGWGHNSSGVLGLGSLSAALRATEILFGTLAYPTQISLSATHACSRMTDGTLWCWGSGNKDGQLGYESTVGVYIPTQVTGLTRPVVEVAAGLFTTCILLDDGSVQCFGDNSTGQLAIGVHDDDRHVTPTTVVFK